MKMFKFISFIFIVVLLVSNCKITVNNENVTADSVYVAEDAEKNIDNDNKDEVKSLKKDVFVFMGRDTYIDLYGAFTKDGWQRQTWAQENISDNVNVLFYSGYEFVSEASWTGETEEDGFCDCLNYKFPALGSEDFVIGVSENINIFPRMPVFPEIDSQYDDVVLNYLKSKGLNNPIASVQNAIIVDVDNDGQDDLFIDALYQESSDNTGMDKMGSYSILLFVKSVDSEKKLIEISSQILLKDAEDIMETIYNNEIIAIVDLNGDGILELVSTSGYYEGSNTDVFSFENDAFVFIMSCGCGA